MLINAPMVASLRIQKESLEKLRLCIIEDKRRLETPSPVSSLAAPEAPCLSGFFICKNCHSNSQDDNTKQRLSKNDACRVPVPECLPNIMLGILCPSSPSIFQAVLWSKYFTSLNNHWIQAWSHQVAHHTEVWQGWELNLDILHFSMAWSAKAHANQLWTPFTK